MSTAEMPDPPESGARIVTARQCSMCRMWKPTGHGGGFHRNGNNGWQGRCKECQKEINRSHSLHSPRVDTTVRRNKTKEDVLEEPEHEWPGNYDTAGGGLSSTELAALDQWAELAARLLRGGRRLRRAWRLANGITRRAI